VTGVLVCVLAFGLLVMIFALLIGLVVSGMVESFSKKAEKSEKDINVESGDESETFENFLLRKIIDPDPVIDPARSVENFLFRKIINPDPVTDPAHSESDSNIFHIPEETDIEIHYADSDK